MSSPPSSTYFLASSPLLTQSPSARRRQKSRFTYKHLSTLSHSATNCPLRVIAHIDLDAFYAQCETVRLDLDPALPLAVQQWQGLIAINYPARAYGLNRHVTITEAKEKCPEIICQHVATWKEGDTKWRYSDDAFKEIATRKVSLDPYRIQSRKILALIKDGLPKDTQRVEKASIDEVFLDLSAQVHSILLQRYPELRGPTPYGDPSEPLPRPPTTVLDWQADALVDVDSSQNEEDDPDWDDICMLIASEIVRDVRAKIYAELKYTCSAGISRNKMLAKLGSGHKKPNSQTVIRNRAVQHFLSGFKFTKIRNLGGKLGDEVVAAFNTEMVSELLSVPIEQLKKQLGDDTGSWLHNVIRGEDSSEVNPRTQIKSMLSAKSFRPSMNSFEVACKWLRIFVADIFSRLVEEGVLEHKRRPKTLNLHHRQGQSTRSKSAPIPSGRQVTEDGLFDLAKNLLAQVVVDGRAWPCANLSLSVGGFEDGVTGNKGIGGFLLHGEDAKASRESHVDEDRQAGILGKSIKVKTKSSRKRKRGQEGGIANFFGKAPMRQESTHSETTSEIEGESGAEGEKWFDSAPVQREADISYDERPDGWEDDEIADELYAEADDPPARHEDGQTSSPSKHLPPLSSDPRPPDPSPQKHHQEQKNQPTPTFDQSGVDTYICPRCSNCVLLDDRTEHEDFHFAQDLQNEAEMHKSGTAPPVPPSAGPSRGDSSSSGRGGGRRGRGRPPKVLGNGAERGQKRLAFG